MGLFTFYVQNVEIAGNFFYLTNSFIFIESGWIINYNDFSVVAFRDSN